MSKKSSKNTRREARTKVADAGPSLFGLKLNNYVAVLIAVAATFLVFVNSFSNDFTNWDDPTYVTQNNLIKPGQVDVGTIFSPSTSVASNYHPLTMLSLALDYKLSGKEPVEPFWFHFTNLFFHLLNVVLVYFLVYYLFKENWLMAFGAALFFGLHPMHVESVTWISERKDVLYAFFFLAGLLVYARKPAERTMGKLGLVFLLFVLSCLSKSAAVVFPLVLLLIDYLQERKWSFATLLEKAPFFLVSLAVGLLAIKTQSESAISVDQFSYVQKVCFASYSLFAYATKLILPLNLSALYPFPVYSSADKLPTLFMLAPVGIIGVFVMMVTKFKNNRPMLFGLLFFVVNLVLVLQVLTFGNALIADRYTYISSIGFFIFLTFFLRWLFTALPSTPKQTNMILPALGMAAAIFYGAQTIKQNKVWKDSVSLWTNAINVTPEKKNPLAYTQRGMHYYESGKPEKAKRDFNEVIKQKPAYHKGYHLRGQIFLDAGQLENAEADFSKALSIYDNDYELWNSRGHLNYKRNLFDDALADFNKSIALNGQFKKSLMNRAIIYHTKFQYDLALKDYNAALALDPNYTLALRNKETLLKAMKK